MATLDDDRHVIHPTPEHYARLDAEVARLRRRRTRGRFAVAAVAAALVVGVAAAGTVAVRSGQAGPAGPTAPSSAPLGAAPQRIPFEGTGVGVVATGSDVWLLRRAPDGSAVLERRDAAGRVLSVLTPPGGEPGGLVADGTRSVWAWAATPGEPTVLTEYDTGTRQVTRTVSRLMTVRAAAAGGGSLWFLGSSQAYAVAPRSTQERGIDGATEAAEHFVFDPAHGQLVFAGLRIVTSADPVTGAGIERAGTTAARSDVAVSGDGALWLSGNDSGLALVRLDPATLEPVAGVPAVRGVAAPVRLFGGKAVVWASGADGSLACLRGRDGSALERWTPAQTGGAQVLAVTAGRGRSVLALTTTALLVLPLDRCPG